MGTDIPTLLTGFELKCIEMFSANGKKVVSGVINFVAMYTTG